MTSSTRHFSGGQDRRRLLQSCTRRLTWSLAESSCLSLLMQDLPASSLKYHFCRCSRLE